jgi:signal transduction histidine kinase
MDMDKRIITLHESFGKGVRRIFEITAYFILIGNFIDILKFADQDKTLLYTNITTIILIIFFLVAYYLRYLSYTIGFSMLIYTILINIFLGVVLRSLGPEQLFRLNFFLRDSLFVFLLIALSAFALHKIHSLIIGSSYVLVMLFFSYMTRSAFLTDNLILILFITLGYIGLIYYLIGLFEKALIHEQDANHTIHVQNNALNEANNILQERQQIIEEQTDKLTVQSDELQIKNEELGQLNDSKNTFFSIIAHDLKNPFNQILGFSSILQNKYSTLSEEKRMHYISLIESASIKTYTLLENLLSWARSQTNSIQMNPNKIILNDLVKEVLELYSERIKIKSLAIVFEPDIPIVCFADRDMIATVIRNLVSNAIKFSIESGKITILLSEENENVLFRIIDTGVGIPSNIVDSLFDIGKHFTTIGTNGETGSGLGLILCKEFINKNGGTIRVDSKEELGSTFTVTIPTYNSTFKKNI